MNYHDVLSNSILIYEQFQVLPEIIHIIMCKSYQRNDIKNITDTLKDQDIPTYEAQFQMH